jgi:glutamyl-tRNA reductase
MASSGYPTDNTFFVESDESASQRMTMRDAAKMLARNKQEMIANELSRQACDEYLEDIMQHMRHMEVRTFLDGLLPEEGC